MKKGNRRGREEQQGGERRLKQDDEGDKTMRKRRKQKDGKDGWEKNMRCRKCGRQKNKGEGTER